MSLVTSRLLAEIPLFSNLDEEERAELHSIMTERTFHPGQHVVKEGEDGAAFYVVQQGEVEIWLNDTEGQKVILDVLGPGKFFGELSMLSGETRSATATSAEEVITLE